MSGNIIDDTIDEFIIKNDLVGVVPLTSSLLIDRKLHKHNWKNGIKHRETINKKQWYITCASKWCTAIRILETYKERDRKFQYKRPYVKTGRYD